MIKFYSFLPDCTRNYPITRASVKNWPWYQRMVDHLRYMQQASDGRDFMHVAKCPGIIDICNQGWLHCAYQNIEIETDGDGASFRWRGDVDQKSQGRFGSLLGNYVDHHPPSDLMMFAEFHRNTLQTIIKIQSPWFVVIPDGYCLLSLPIPYTENLSFSAAPGILRGIAKLNVQLFWHELKGNTLLAAGTPLCQYILLPDTDDEFEIIDGDETIWPNLSPWLSGLKTRYPGRYDHVPTELVDNNKEQP